MRRWPRIVCLLATIAVVQHAAAEPTASVMSLHETLRGDGLAAYEAGRVAFSDDDFEGAFRKFREAHQHSGHPQLLWNMATCQKELRNYAQVMSLVERYVNESGDTLSPAKRLRTEQLLEAVAQYVAPVTLVVAQDGATIRIDGAVVGTSPLDEPVRVTHGRHEIRISKSGFAQWRQGIEFEGGRSLTLSIVLAEQREEGTLIVETAADAHIQLDGRPVGIGRYEGVLRAGDHQLTVSAADMQTHVSTVHVHNRQTLERLVSLSPALDSSDRHDRRGVRRKRWIWGLTAVVLAAGTGVALGLFLKDPGATEPIEGTLNPGVVEVGAFGWP